MTSENAFFFFNAIFILGESVFTDIFNSFVFLTNFNVSTCSHCFKTTANRRDEEASNPLSAANHTTQAIQKCYLPLLGPKLP